MNKKKYPDFNIYVGGRQFSLIESRKKTSNRKQRAGCLLRDESNFSFNLIWKGWIIKKFTEYPKYHLSPPITRKISWRLIEQLL